MTHDNTPNDLERTDNTEDIEDTDPTAEHIHTLQNDDDPERRRSVAKMLSILGTDTATEALAEALQNDDDPSVRVEVANALSNIGTENALQALQTPLKNPHPHVQAAVAIARAQHTPQDAHTELLDALQHPNDLTPELLDKTLRALSQNPSQETVDTLTDIAQSDLFSNLPTPAQRSLLRSLQHHPNDSTRSLLTQYASNTNHPEPLRTAATKALSTHNHPDTLNTLTNLLQDPSPNLQITAAHTLSDIGTPEAAKPLQQALTPDVENDDVRDAFAFALLTLNAPPSCGWEPFLQDPHEGVRSSAEEATQTPTT